MEILVIMTKGYYLAIDGSLFRIKRNIVNNLIKLGIEVKYTTKEVI